MYNLITDHPTIANSNVGYITHKTRHGLATTDAKLRKGIKPKNYLIK